MGLDLTLLVLTHDTADWGFAHTMLDLDRTGIADVVMESGLATTPVPRIFKTFASRADGKDSHYGETQTTPYGDKLECVTAGQLLPLADSSECVKRSHVNRAAWAYLAELPESTRVALYYH